MITYQESLWQCHFWFNCDASTSWKINCNV